MKNEIKQDERTQKQNQTATAEAYYVVMAFLFITIIVKQMFLHQRFAEYVFEFAAFALGGAYALIRSLFFGTANYNKKSMRFVPIIISVVLTAVILVVNMKNYKAADNMDVLFLRASLAFVIMLAFGYSFLFIVSFINRRRTEKLTHRYK